MRIPPHPGLLLVATREIRWMLRDHLAVFLVIGVPLIALAVLGWTFSSAVIRDLGVAVVDDDRTPTSSQLVQAIAASPSAGLTMRPDNLHDAMRAIRSGAAMAAVYIPAGLERDVAAGRRPRVEVFYNTQYFTPGNVASRGLQSAIQAAVQAMVEEKGVKPTPAIPGTLVVEQYVLSNPALNYAQFLLRAVLPAVLHVVMTIAAVYAVGSELGRRSRRAWLRAAGGSPLAALVGKLLPLYGAFVLQMVLIAVLIHGVFHVPFRGSGVLMAAAALLFVAAYLALGALLPLLTRNLALALSLSGLIASPAFGYAGVGFPTADMNAFARHWGDCLPLKWYISILFDQAARGLPASGSVPALLVLGAMALLFGALAWLRLRSLRWPAREPAKAPIAAGPGIAGAFAAEWRRVLADKGVFGLLVMAPIIYGFFYPQPYLGQLVRDVPIAVVDQDHTELSRTLIQALDADETVRVAVLSDTIAEANAALQAHRVFGVLAIPPGTAREVLKGNAAHLPAFVDSAYFLVFNRMVQGILESAGAVTVDTLSHGARPDGSLARAALSQAQPIEVLAEPLYNPVGGYASYVVPAAFMLILQQTLLMGSAMLGGVGFEQGGRAGRRGLPAVIGHALAHLTLYVPALALYLVILPRLYGFSTLGGLPSLILVAIPFILAVSFLGQLVGSMVTRRETAVLVFLASGMPLFFLVGVSWPREAIPPMLQDLSRVFPSTSAIDALVRVNQMGADLHDVHRDWLALWILAAIFLAFTLAVQRLAGRRFPRGRAA
ncbi:MAG TPA: ABC transporter permease [Dongiaceae bacterium]|jgi:ABC-2 type transport system permease protein|nr:ABC transporter permease [Dongiaceae bacterium]